VSKYRLIREREGEVESYRYDPAVRDVTLEESKQRHRGLKMAKGSQDDQQDTAATDQTPSEEPKKAAADV